jgi:hypothetical protein
VLSSSLQTSRRATFKATYSPEAIDILLIDRWMDNLYSHRRRRRLPRRISNLELSGVESLNLSASIEEQLRRSLWIHLISEYTPRVLPTTNSRCVSWQIALYCDTLRPFLRTEFPLLFSCNKYLFDKKKKNFFSPVFFLVLKRVILLRVRVGSGYTSVHEVLFFVTA